MVRGRFHLSRLKTAYHAIHKDAMFIINDFIVLNRGLASSGFEKPIICETSHVLLAGVSGGFSPGTPVFAPPTD